MFSHSSRSNQSTISSIPGGGFGLIELMVSISIMAIILGVVLVRQDGFNSSVLLRGEAYKVALTIREVQLSAVSAIGRASTTNSTVVDDFRTPIGLYFDTDTPNTYIIFEDTGSLDGAWDANDNQIDQGVIDLRFALQEVNESDTGSVSIIFERPDFDADISSGGTATLTLGEVGVSDGETRIVEVTSTGQIAIIE